MLRRKAGYCRVSQSCTYCITLLILVAAVRSCVVNKSIFSIFTRPVVYFIRLLLQNSDPRCIIAKVCRTKVFASQIVKLCMHANLPPRLQFVFALSLLKTKTNFKVHNYVVRLSTSYYILNRVSRHLIDNM